MRVGEKKIGKGLRSREFVRSAEVSSVGGDRGSEMIDAQASSCGEKVRSTCPCPDAWWLESVGVFDVQSRLAIGQVEA